jgi:hypothetical protein
MIRDFANWVDLLDTIWSKLDVGSEVLNPTVLVQGAVDKGRLNDALLPLCGLEQALSETGTSHSHGESCRASAALSLDNLVTTELDTVDVLIELVTTQVVAGLGKERNDGGTGVATDNGDVLVSWVGVLELGDEAAGAHDVEGGDTEKTLGIVDASGLEDLGGDWNGGVDLVAVSYFLVL